MPEWNTDPEAIQATLRASAALLTDAGIPFVLAGGMAAWARGGPESVHDIDFVVTADVVEKALLALGDGGLRVEEPPEKGWLYKAWDDDVLIDVIFRTKGVDPETILADAEQMEVLAVDMRVMTLDHVMVTKLSAISELNLDFSSCLKLARALREQINWPAVRTQTNRSPFAAAFFTLIEGLGILPS